MSILFIVNPAAGKGKAKNITPIIERICRDNSLSYEIRYTTGPNEASRIVGDGVRYGFERIVAVGGDGTVNEVVNGMAGGSAALGIIPAGSGNDFIRSINNSNRIEDIIYQNIFGNIKSIDIGRCNEKYFINVASVGLDAEVADRVKNIKKLITGKGAYLTAALSTIFAYSGMKLCIEIDGLTFQKNTLLIAIANGKYYGGGILPAPLADVSDGYFDICLVERISKFKIPYLIPKYVKGQHQSIKEVSFYRGRKVKLECDKNIVVNIDGETFRDKNIEFEIIHGGINIIVPEEE